MPKEVSISYRISPRQSIALRIQAYKKHNNQLLILSDNDWISLPFNAFDIKITHDGGWTETVTLEHDNKKDNE